VVQLLIGSWRTVTQIGDLLSGTTLVELGIVLGSVELFLDPRGPLPPLKVGRESRKAELLLAQLQLVMPRGLVGVDELLGREYCLRVSHLLVGRGDHGRLRRE